MEKVSTKTTANGLAGNHDDVKLLEAFYARDCGHAEAATLSFEVQGIGVEILMRESIPVGTNRDIHMRVALAHVCEMLIAWANMGENGDQD